MPALPIANASAGTRLSRLAGMGEIGPKNGSARIGPSRTAAAPTRGSATNEMSSQGRDGQRSPSTTGETRTIRRIAATDASTSSEPMTRRAANGPNRFPQSPATAGSGTPAQTMFSATTKQPA